MNTETVSSHREALAKIICAREDSRLAGGNALYDLVVSVSLFLNCE